MSSKFVKNVIEEINSFRVKPTYIEKKLETFKTGLTRFKGNGAFVKEIENFIKSIGSMPKMTKVEQNDDLTKSAEEQLKKFLSDSNYAKYVRGNNMQGKIPDAYVEQNCCLIADDGAETEADVPIKILLNKMDKEKIGRQYLTNNDYTQIGVAHAMNSDDENCVVIILAKAPAEEESPAEEEPESLAEYDEDEDEDDEEEDDGVDEDWAIRAAESDTPEAGAQMDKDLKADNSLTDEGYAAFDMPWSLSLNYSLRVSQGTFKPETCSYVYNVSQSLNVSGSLALTSKWKFSVSTGYSFDEHKLSQTSIGITRDLHCWSMAFNVVPVGLYKSYSFNISVSSSMLRDLKYEQNSSPRDNGRFR